MIKAIVVADAHLKSPAEQEYKDMLSFLDTTVLPDKELDAVFFLGDLFDFFVGFPHVIFYEHMQILQRLHSLCEQGKQVFYFEGNHDFFLKKMNAAGFPVNVVEKGLDVNFNGRFLVTHGDLINKRDYSHRAMSAIVRNPLTYLLAYLLPPYLVYEFAHFFSRFSRENISSKREFSDKIFDGFFQELAERGYIGAILGHYHKNLTVNKTINGANITLHLLGSWKEDRSYMLFENNALKLCKYME